MIGIESQYVLRFSLEDKKDFITNENLLEFKVIEEGNNVLPTFLLSFFLVDDTLLNYLNEGATLSMSVGRNKDDLKDIPLIITKAPMLRTGKDQRMVSLIGLYNALPYLTQPKVQCTTKMSGVEAMRTTVSAYFKWDSNIDVSEDSQNWVQPSIADKSFVNELLAHSKVTDSFLACGISADGRFILRDIKKRLKTQYDWRFTTNVQDTNKDISFAGDITYDNDATFMNNWFGYEREKWIYDLTAGTQQLISEPVTPFMAMTSKLMRQSAITKKAFEAGAISKNVDPSYWNSYLTNIAHMAMFSSCQATVSFGNVYKDIKPLDLCMLRDDAIGQPGQTSSDVFSGLWLAGKVVRSVTSKQYLTFVELNRESFNETGGAVR